MATDQPDLASSSSQMILDWIKVTIKVNQQCKYGNIFLKYEKFYRFSSMRNFTGSILPTARKKIKAHAQKDSTSDVTWNWGSEKLYRHLTQTYRWNLPQRLVKLFSVSLSHNEPETAL